MQLPTVTDDLKVAWLEASLLPHFVLFTRQELSG